MLGTISLVISPLEEIMSSQAYAPYRGCGITVQVTVAKSHALGGACRRFRVSWTVSLPGIRSRSLHTFDSFPLVHELMYVAEQTQVFNFFAYSGSTERHTYIF